MPFTQETFFGASIRNWTSSMGWEGSPATCTVNVVVDPLNSDSFVTPIIGMPATMQYQTWSFSGIVQSYKRTNSSSTNPEYSITLVDAREILDAAKVIVGSYTGSVLGVPNLYNVYGLYESGGYGNSGWNEAGMPWANVKNGLLSLINGGSPLSFRGYNYLLDLSWLPSMPADYRIAGPSLSILEFVSQVCQDGGHDFFVQLVGNIITVKTISRVAQPASFNEINSFVSYVGGQISSEAGRELRNETTSKMVIGGQRVDMWFQPYNGQQGTFASIWPFWGFSPTVVNGSTYFFPIIGTGTGDSHNFSTYVGHLGLPIPAYYNITVLELRAALAGYENWLFFMSGYKSGILSMLGGNSSVWENVELLRTGTAAEIRRKPVGYFQHPLTNNRNTISQGLQDNQMVIEGYLQSLYRFVSGYANDYYGKQFMVAIPNVGVRLNGSEYDLSMSLEGGAWYDESTYGSYLVAANAGYLPFNLNAAAQNDGRIQCMMRIQNYSNYNFDEIPLDSLIDSGTNMFIKSEPVGITFINPALFTGPRAIIKMANSITVKDNQATFIWHLLNQLLNDNGGLSAAEVTEIKDRFNKEPIARSMKWSTDKIAIMPDMALVPLKNKLLTYGPWVAIGTAGKVDVEIMDDLVPWNYGGMTPMNTIGQAAVSSAITNLQESESGYVEFPGVPEVALGVPITAGGPYVTDVSVSIGEGGATTRYNMKTWTPKFGQVGKTQLGVMQRIIKNQQGFRTQLRNRMTDILRSPQFQRVRQKLNNPTTIDNTAHLWIQSRVTVDDVTNFVENSTSISASAPSCGTMTTDAETGAAMTLDGLFAPFNNGVGVSNGIPGLTDPNAVVDFRIIPQQGQLNHFIEYDSFRAVQLGDIPVLGGQSSSGPTLVNDDNKERFVALRGPLMLAGYGYDVRGLPVPNREIDDGVFGAEDEFSLNHRQRSDKWRVGPVDLRWDEQRGVWVSDHQILEGKLNGGIFANGTGLMEVYRKDADGNWTGTGRNILLKNRSNCDFENDAFVVAAKINYEWRPIFSCGGGSGELDERCYQGFGKDVEYDDFTCLNEWVEDPDSPGGRRAPTEEDDPGDINQQNFTCADDFMNTVEVVTNVFCVDDEIVVCTRKLCLPDSWVSVEDCGDKAPPGSVPCCNDPDGGFMIGSTLEGEIRHNDGFDITTVLPGGALFNWTLNTTTNRYKQQWTIPSPGGLCSDVVLTFTAYCDIEDDVWHLLIGTDCEEGNVTATASIPACAADSEVVWTNVAIPNCVINNTRDDSVLLLNCDSNEEPLGEGTETRVDIYLRY